MKKILITGMNKAQCTENYYLRQQLKVVPSHYSLVRCLRDMGYEVDQRIVEIGEDLSDYHKVICYIAAPNQRVCSALYNGLWAIHSTPKDRLVLAIDDWQTHGIFTSIAQCDSKETLFRKFVMDNSMVKGITPESLDNIYNELAEAIKWISSKQSPMLLSVFAGGDITKLIDYPEENLFGYNPNPYHLNRKYGDRDDIPVSEMSFMESSTVIDYADDYVKPVDKLQKFNFASLVQSQTKSWLKKQRVSWEIEFFGSKAEKQRRLTEGEMCKVFGETWGCLMPGYKHAGSGWWRARPLQLADFGSVLLGDRDELILYYGDEDLANLTADDLESMSVGELTELARMQKDALYKLHPLDKSVQQTELNKVLK